METDLKDYERPSLASDVVVFCTGEEAQDNYRKLPQRHLRTLLLQRTAEPFRNQWALPGGIIHSDQTAEEAALQTLKSKAGICNVYAEQLYTFSDIDRDPRGWVISCAYLALAEEKAAQEAELAQGARWFDTTLALETETIDYSPTGRCQRRVYRLELEAPGTASIRARVQETIITSSTRRSQNLEVLEDGELAFDHAKIVVYAILRLRGKIEYTDLALNLMPELFTLSALQSTYEVILGRELLKPAFRRSIQDMVIPTDESTSSGGHRPSVLYRRNWNL